MSVHKDEQSKGKWYVMFKGKKKRGFTTRRDAENYEAKLHLLEKREKIYQIIEDLDVSTCTFRKNTTLEDVLDFYKNYSTILSVTGSTNSEENKLPYGIVKHTYEAQTGELQEDKSNADGNGIFDYATWKLKK